MGDDIDSFGNQFISFKKKESKMKQWMYRTMLVAIALCLLVGCATPVPTATPQPEQPSGGDVALKITGMVEQEMGWSEDKIKAMETMESQSTNKAGEVSTYTGVSIKALLDLAKPQADAQTVVYVADDGFTGEVSLAEVTACADCIVSFRNQGGFSIVMPGFPGNLQVKGVIEIQVK
jgi:hypothetical protein